MSFKAAAWLSASVPSQGLLFLSCAVLRAHELDGFLSQLWKAEVCCAADEGAALLTDVWGGRPILGLPAMVSPAEL